MALHLTAEEREVVSQMLYAKASKAEIARRLQRDRSTIFRELERNSCGGRYSAVQAQRRAEERHRRARQRSRKMNRPELRAYVFEHLRQYWSPEQIAGRLPRDFPDDRRLRVSPPTIYKYLATPLMRHLWAPYLRGSRPTSRLRSGASKASIATRPEVINRRERFGDWEGDTMLGTRRRTDGALVALVERKSGYLELNKVVDRRSSRVVAAIERRLQQHPPELRLSCTFDNGPEFSRHEQLQKKLQLATYFADPHAPWQRGSNEHVIRLVRQFFPKGKPLRQLAPRTVARVMDLLNDRPRKRLDYRTPREVLAEQCCRAIQT
ncbi:MAG: IS30 family transposase [Solirubrobacterales bacterium]